MSEPTSKYDQRLVTIGDSSLDVSQIVKEIKLSIKKKKVDYLRELKKDLPSVLDTTENSEFLLNGWYKNESISGIRAKWTEKEFSFLFNLRDSNRLNLGIISTPPKVDKKPLDLNLYIKDKKIDQQTINTPGQQRINFQLPDQYKNKNLVIEIRLSYDFSPVQEHKTADTRKLGIAVKKISNLPYTEVGNKYIPQLTGFETQAPLELEKIKYHINPQNLLPQQTRLKFVKKLILRIISVYTSIQIGFNQHVYQFLANIVDYLTNLSKYVKNLEGKLVSLEEEVDNLKPYQSLYWEEKKEDFYDYHQNYFRGDYQNTKSNLSVYTDYLNDPEFYKKAPFIDFGPGRGEFLELLKEKEINSLGVDLNKIFVDQLQEKGYTVYLDDALNFLKSYNQKIGGASAFHLIEHFTFPQFFDFLYLVHQKLKPEGLLLLETPNLNNLSVGATTFYYDPTHQTQLPPLLLRKVLEFVGYSKINALKLHPEKETEGDRDVKQKIFGPQDYGIIAKK